LRREELEALAELTLNKCLQKDIEDAAILVTAVQSQLLNFSNNEIIGSQSWSETSISIMLGKSGKRSVIHMNNTSPEAIAKAVEQAFKNLERQKPGTYASLPKAPRRVIGTELQCAFEEIVEKQADMAYEAIEAALSEGASRVAGSISSDHHKLVLVTSSGFTGFDSRFSISLNVRAFANGDASGQSAITATSLNDIKASQIGSEAGRLAKEARNPIEVAEGTYDVLLGYLVVANLVNELADFASAYHVLTGFSPLADKLNAKIASEKLTLIDDGLDPCGPGSRRFDDEGVDCQRTTVIEDGVLKTYLHNLTTAKQFNTFSTGNAGWLVPSPWNIKVKEGGHSFEELLCESRRCLFVTNNWYTRFHNYRTGDFSTICRDAAFLVENGEVKKAVKGIRISDNLMRMMCSIKALSRDRRWVEWWEVETPSLVPMMLIQGVRITKAQA